MGSERTANRLLIALFYEVNSSARKRKNIMCAFHHSRQTGSLFERQGGERTLCVLFMADNFICAGREKHKSFKALIMKSSEKLGKWFLRDWRQEMR